MLNRGKFVVVGLATGLTLLATLIIFWFVIDTDEERALELVKSACGLELNTNTKTGSQLWEYPHSGLSSQGKSLTDTAISEIKLDADNIKDSARIAFEAKTIDGRWADLENAFTDEYEFVSNLYKIRLQKGSLDFLILNQFPKYQSAVAKQDVLCNIAASELNK